jgi:phage baseplate assembly protein W
MSVVQSDYIAKTGAPSVKVARTKVFADLDLSLILHPERNDLVPKYDIEAIKSSVKNLVQTNFSERPFQPFLGSNIRALLFEPVDAFTGIAIKNEIVRVLEQYEPRITGITIQLNDDMDRNAYYVTIGFTIIGFETYGTVEFFLKRLR